MPLSVDWRFDGAVVLITGGGSGIGAASARACAAAGATVIAADHDPKRVASMQGIANLEAVQLDVADAEAVRALVAGILARHGRVDAAVMAAAIQMRTMTEAISDAEWRRHQAVNIDGVFHCVRELIPVMQRQRSGSLLAFTSGLVGIGQAGASAYAASKGAITGFMKCVAQELRPYGARANVLSPGLMATPIWLDVADQAERDAYANSVGVSPPEDVVPTVLHLISDASASLTGAVIERRLVPGGK